MKMKLNHNKIISFFLCLMLTVAMALCTIGCNGKETTQETQSTQNEGTAGKSTVLGEGQTVFEFTVTDAEGKDTAFEIHTDSVTVGDALLENGLIAGDEGDYGLYVKTVNGITADYDVDGTYWAFYVNNEYAVNGVDTTNITAGDTYSFKVEK